MMYKGLYSLKKDCNRKANPCKQQTTLILTRENNPCPRARYLVKKKND